MFELESLPSGAFVSGLQFNLERFASLPKVFDHYLEAVRVHLDADAVWLRRVLRESRTVAEDYVLGTPRSRDDDRIARFTRHERPPLPRSLLLSPVKVNGRIEAVVGAERHEREFERGRGWALNRLATVLALDLTRREEERLVRVLDDIKEKIVAELRPRDLAYQILDGLHQLLHFDHSAALLIYDASRRVLRVEADKIAWTKAKSAFIGHEVRLVDGLERSLKYPAPIFTFPAASPAEADKNVETALFDLLYYHRGETIPSPQSILCAPLYFDEALVGLLKVASRDRLAFDAHDRRVAERFLPAAAVALRNARERVTLEKQALDAEVRAGLVTLARAVAHDVNNAMGSLVPLAEQVRDELREGKVDPPTLVADMDVVLEKAHLCKRIFANMLRLGAGKLGSGPVDVNATVREMLPLLSAKLLGGAATLTLDLAESFPVVTFSKPHLERILWNLVTNAVEASDDPAAETRVVIRTRVGPVDGAVLAVLDDGPGIAEDVIERIMEPFFTTKEHGSGLGLSICRALAWQGGGQLRVTSRPGEGTEVTIAFRTGTETEG